MVRLFGCFAYLFDSVDDSTIVCVVLLFSKLGKGKPFGGLLSCLVEANLLVMIMRHVIDMYSCVSVLVELVFGVYFFFF